MGWYFVIRQESREMGLKGNELLIYSFLDGYSQEGQGCYYGSLARLAEVCGITKRTAISSVKALVAKGLISKREIYGDGARRVAYSVMCGDDEEVKNLHPEVKKFHHEEVKNFHLGGEKISPNKKEINIYNNIYNSAEKKFDFREALKSEGVSAEVADQYLQVRKAKNLVNTEIAFSRLLAEIRKTGRPAEEIVRLCVERSWGGFSADWLLKEENERGSAQRNPSPVAAAPSPRRSAVGSMLDEFKRFNGLTGEEDGRDG